MASSVAGVNTSFGGPKQTLSLLKHRTRFAARKTTLRSCDTSSTVRPLALQPFHQLVDFRLPSVHRGSLWFVEQQHVRFAEQRKGDERLLELPAGKTPMLDLITSGLK